MTASNGPAGNGPFLLPRHPAHLSASAGVIPQTAFTADMAWYEGYGLRHGDDGTQGRLLSMHTFSEPWNGWEMHPEGAEVVICTRGEMVLVQEVEGRESRVRLTEGEYAINPPGVWHTADVEAPVTAVFITVGAGTQHRPR